MPPTKSSACPSGMLGHPLEFIPLLRRWPRSGLRDVIYTLVWNTLIALIFTMMAIVFDPRTPILGALRGTFVVAQCIGFFIHALFILGDRLLPGMHRRGMPARFAYYTIVPLIGVLGGYPIAAQLLGWTDFLSWLLTPRALMSMALLSVLISGILLAIFVQRERAARAETAFALEQARVAAAERETQTARLKLLEAQVEPHFLYNTLAHVISLIDREPATARHMIERLIELLRATASAPGNAGTLAEQLRWLRAYLDLLKLRMGGRLAWRIDVPSELLGLEIAPMLLQPLVENAIKHGLEPKIEGGQLEIAVRREQDGVRLTVRDSGLGFPATRRAGEESLGLANLRARLRASYGERARVVIEDNAPSGACVSVLLPVSA